MNSDCLDSSMWTLRAKSSGATSAACLARTGSKTSLALRIWTADWMFGGV